MKVTDAGHRYELHPLDGGPAVELRFVKREGEGYPGNVGRYSGTNCQEVLRVLIDRVQYLHNQIGAPENHAVVNHLRLALVALERRAAHRHGRSLKAKTLNIEHVPFCIVCGHVECNQHPAEYIAEQVCFACKVPKSRHDPVDTDIWTDHKFRA